MMKQAPLFIVCAVLPLLVSCAGLVEKTGRLLDGSARAEKTLAVYRSMPRSPPAPGALLNRGIELRRVRSRTTEEEFFIIKPEAFPNVRLRCSAPAPDGGFSFIACEYLEAGSAGWNEFSMELSGSGGKFWEQGNIVFIQFEGAFEPAQITDGKIRYGSKRRSGAEALTGLKNRFERIAALTEWMRAYPDVPAFSNRNEFNAFWEPLLLPELSRRGRKMNGLWNGAGTEWVRSEGFKWNARYTEALFPEELRVLRDSGALLRDWEEAPFWIYFIYSWDDLEQILSSELPLFKD
jgi:hypothetical protein